MASAPVFLLPASGRPQGLGVCLLLLAGGAAAALDGPASLAFAIVAVLGVGMLHGISDLALVEPGRRPWFLATYLLLAGVIMAAWRWTPNLALALFLVASMAHFGLEDAPASRPAERFARGLLMVAGPALLHRQAIARLFEDLAVGQTAAASFATLLQSAALTALLLLPLALRERGRDGTDSPLTSGLAFAALLLLPPLIGFSIGFVTLHAEPELRERLREGGYSSLHTYFAAHWPIAAGAAMVVTTTGWLLADHVALPLAMLFAGIAALALPHMIVTPLWRRPSRTLTR